MRSDVTCIADPNVDRVIASSPSHFVDAISDDLVDDAHLANFVCICCHGSNVKDWHVDDKVDDETTSGSHESGPTAHGVHGYDGDSNNEEAA